MKHNQSPQPPETGPRETKPRTCAACGASYDYPEPGSPATRFHCAVCIGIPAETRRAIEALNKRLRALEKALEKGK